MAVAEGPRDDLLGLVQEVARIDQIGGRLQLLRGADAVQDGRDTIGVGERVLAGVQQSADSSGSAKARARTTSALECAVPASSSATMGAVAAPSDIKPVFMC
jgi:hypothetical protein